MKLLMFYSPEFWVKPFEKAAAEAPDDPREETFRNAVVIFCHKVFKDI